MENQAECGLRSALKVIGGKWNMIIIKSLGNEELRFGEIKQLIPDISEKVLIDKLKALCQYELVFRKNFNEVPPKVSYRLSPQGQQVLLLVGQIEQLGNQMKW